MVVPILVVFAIPLMHCSTNTTAGTDTGARSNALSDGGSCQSSTNPNGPIICIDSSGNATPSSVTAHSHNDQAAVPIVFKTANGTGTLNITTSCSQIALQPGCGNSAVCSARTVPGNTGTCTYSASVDGAPAADPIIVTDNCCPTTEGDPRPTRP